VLQVSGAAAVAGDAGLYDQPVLTLDAGMHIAMITRVDVSTTGAYAVTGSDDKTVRLWAAPTGQWLRTIRLPQEPGHVGRVYAVAISPDGALVAAGGQTTSPSQPEHIYLFHRDTGALVRRLDSLTNVVTHLAFSPTGRYPAATLGGTSGLHVYDRDDGWREVARDGAYGDTSYGAAFAADERLATTSYDGTLHLYDRAFRPVAGVKAPDGTRPFGVAFTPAGDRLAVGYQDTTAVSLIDGHTLTPLPGPDTRGLDHGNLMTVAWSADGATLYADGTYDHAGTKPVMAWSGAGAGPRREWAAGTDTIMSLRPLPDGGLLVGAGDPWLGVLDPARAPRWVQRPPQADLRGQRQTLRVSADGGVVDFGYERGGRPRPASTWSGWRSPSARRRTGRPGPRSRPPSRSNIGRKVAAPRSTARRWCWTPMKGRAAWRSPRTAGASSLAPTGRSAPSTPTAHRTGRRRPPSSSGRSTSRSTAAWWWPPTATGRFVGTV
jgi:WD40 repeat protein